ncbi:DUF1223 domain-containing protein [Flavobacteriaceae bacterium 3-367]
MFKKIIGAVIVLVSLGFMAFTGFTQAPENDSANTAEAMEEGVYEPIVVLELYTSQGCSSCPPADALLDKVKKEYQENVFALSYHVDYWNYIGWKDPFSKSEYAEKQRAYNIKFRNRSNYTPQVVVNGQEHFVGSSASKMYSKINTYQKVKAGNRVGISQLKAADNSVGFQYEIKGSTKGKRLRAILVLDQRITEVKRGENRNRTLRNSNIVVAEKTISAKEGKASSYIAIPDSVGPNEKIQLMLLVENDTYDITGAAKGSVER